MRTQLNCPQCGTPFAAEVNQIIDVDSSPQLKQQFLAGQLNVAVCPACGAGGQLATPLIYHDSAYELFMVYIPQEIHMSQMEREQMIGRMTRQVVDNLPPEKRKAYLFQPQTILNMQTFAEKVLETEGITKEMIERQRKQSELLNTLARADNDVIDYLLKDRKGEIDETFFAMLQSYIDNAQQTQNDKLLVKLTNLRAKLMTETPAGQQLEKEQIAMHRFSRDAKKQGGISPALLLEHIVKNLGNDGAIEKLVMTGQSALTYDFFALLTAELEQQEKDGNQETVRQLTAVREDLLQVQSQLQAASQQMVDEAMATLQALLRAPNKEEAIRQNMERLDDAFMYILSANIAQATQQGDQDHLQALSNIQSLIVKEIESQYPPEVIFLNQLMEAESEAAQQALLNDNAHLISPNLIQMVEAVEKQVEGLGQEDLKDRLQAVKDMIQARL
ncbi:MAG: CpXC domain-containing protein [Anaerolineales bacterium]|nr:CpXC domain-containing protein [Anaerolineales bacterium]MCB8969096.1 CpXC domain-containing protein [Ardenticatenaceae bacterium]